MVDSEKGQFAFTLTPTAQEPHTPEPVAEKPNAQSDSLMFDRAPLEDGRSNLNPERGDEWAALEKRVRWKVDLRLCSIGGLLCSLNLLDSGILSSASVTTMLDDLDLNQGNR